MTIEELLKDVKDYTVISPEDKVDIWTYLNGMENYESFEERRKFRVKIEKVLGIKES